MIYFPISFLEICSNKARRHCLILLLVFITHMRAQKSRTVPLIVSMDFAVENEMPRATTDTVISLHFRVLLKSGRFAADTFRLLDPQQSS